MKTKFLVLLLIYFGSLPLLAQKYTISGYLEDASTGEKLISATVFEKTQTAGTVSNTYGFYSITLPAGEVELSASYLGYTGESKTLILDKDMTLNFYLQPSLELEEIVVEAEATEKLAEKTQMSTIDVPLKQIKSLPAFAGEVDVLKVIQLLPGVQSGSEGGSGIYVRGGGPDQNLILLDGVPVYNVSHLAGFFSVFNADAIKNVNLVKGGYPARYGGRLSSVLNINMKEGNMKEFHGEGSISLIASKLTLEGPIIKDKTSFIVSGRRTYLDLLTRPIIRYANRQNGTNTSAGYYFYDLNAKINHKFSEKDRLYLSVYKGRDKGSSSDSYDGDYNSDDGFRSQYESSTDIGLGWGNLISALRWNHQFSPKLFANTTLTYTKYDFKTEYEDTFNDQTYYQDQLLNEYYYNSSFAYGSDITDWGGKIDFDYVPSPKHYIRFGVNGIYHTFKPGVVTLTEDYEGGTEVDTTISSNTINATEFYTYIEDDFQISSRLKANFGLHASMFNVKGKTYQSLQPRFAARYMINENWSAKASYAQMTQYLHLLTTSGLSLPTDLWVPPTDIVGPQRSWQVAAGLAYNFKLNGKNDYEISVEGYYKKMDDLITYREGASFVLVADSWENKVTVGQGWSYGGEFFLQKKKGKTTGWLGYTLSWTLRQFDDVNFGEKYPYKFDRRHDLSLTMVHQLNDRIDLSAAFVYGTGNSITLPTAQYTPFEGNPSGENGYEIGYSREVYEYGGKNSFRMGAYHRLDLGINFHKEKKWGTRTWSFSVYNTYNRRNPFFIYRSRDWEATSFESRDSYVFKQVSLFPIIPSFAYSFKF